VRVGRNSPETGFQGGRLQAEVARVYDQHVKGRRHQMPRYITFAAVAALMIAAMTVPRPVTSAALGAGWSCSQNSFVTTCRRPA
jgi:hypothetical protein